MTTAARTRPERIKGGLPRRLPPDPEDVRGLAFWSLTAVRFVGLLDGNDAVWQCRCQCGARCDAALSALRAGTTRACAKCSPPPSRRPAPSEAERQRRAAKARAAVAAAAARMALFVVVGVPPRPLMSDEEIARLYTPFGGAQAYGGDNEYRFKEPGRLALPAATVVATKTALG